MPHASAAINVKTPKLGKRRGGGGLSKLKARLGALLAYVNPIFDAIDAELAPLDDYTDKLNEKLKRRVAGPSGSKPKAAAANRGLAGTAASA